MEILKRSCEALHRKTPEIWHDVSILHQDSAPFHESLCVKQFLAQKLITAMEHPSRSPDLASNDF
jgi:hypothetical protein